MALGTAPLTSIVSPSVRQPATWRHSCTLPLVDQGAEAQEPDPRSSLLQPLGWRALRGAPEPWWGAGELARAWRSGAFPRAQLVQRASALGFAQQQCLFPGRGSQTSAGNRLGWSAPAFFTHPSCPQGCSAPTPAPLPGHAPRRTCRAGLGGLEDRPLPGAKPPGI